MGKHCADDSCPGVYEDDDTCSHCGKADPTTLQYLHVEFALDGRRQMMAHQKLWASAKLDDEGLVLDVYSNETCIATGCKPYTDMQVSVRRWYEGDVPSLKELCAMVKEGRHAELGDILERAHPCVTAMVLVQGSLDKLLTMSDCNVITNILMDRKTAENE